MSMKLPCLWWLVPTSCFLSPSSSSPTFSYFTAILQMHSPEGRHKAFSTCGSHLTVVALFHGTLFWMYLRPPSVASVEQTKIAAVFYIFLSPMLNPLIYSLQNKDFKGALRRVIQEKLFVNWVHIWPEVCNIFVLSDQLERILN